MNFITCLRLLELRTTMLSADLQEPISHASLVSSPWIFTDYLPETAGK